MPTGDDQSYLANEQRAGLNLVFVDRPPRLLRADTVLSDNVERRPRGGPHLLAHGHTRIAFLGDLEEIPTATERFAGYRQALDRGRHRARARAGRVRHPRRRRRRGDRAAPARRAPADRPVHRPERDHHRRRPGRCATSGCATGSRWWALTTSPSADLLEPPVTIVAQDPAAIGAAACQRLFERMDGDGGPPQSVIIPTRLAGARLRARFAPTAPAANERSRTGLSAPRRSVDP